MVAGLVAKFIPDGEPYPMETGFMGEPGQTPPENSPGDITEDLKAFHLPHTDFCLPLQTYSCRKIYHVITITDSC